MKNFIYSILLIFCFSGCYNSVKQTISIGHEPEIWPDYSGVTIPYEIAPMNFNFVGCAYNYLKLIEMWYVQIILHAIILLNAWFLYKGEKYYNEDVGVE